MAEVIYAVRRTDGEDIGEYSFLVVGSDSDWSPAQDDSDYADEPIEYELVKMTVEVVATRKFPECSDLHCSEPATHWGLCEPHARIDDPEHFADEEPPGEVQPSAASTEAHDGR